MTFTITSTHTSTRAARKYIQPYLHKVFACTKHNNLTLNPDITTCTLFTPAEYKSNLDLKINHTVLLMATHPKVLGLKLDPNSHAWSSKECACCTCDPSGVRLDSPSYVLFVLCMSEVISSFKSSRAGSPYVVSLFLFYTMWSRKGLQLLCILPIGMLCVSVIIMIFVKQLC